MALMALSPHTRDAFASQPLPDKHAINDAISFRCPAVNFAMKHRLIASA